MKIAISLLTHNDQNLLKPALDSLFNSDLNQHEYKFFCYDNNSNQILKDILEGYKINKWIHYSNTNDGIVIPRIKVYEQILKENFDLLLEIHTDMIFPKEWINPLLELLDEDTGILEPHIYSPKRGNSITIEQFENLLPKLKYDKTYNKCRQIHPWIVKLSILDKIGGYYDANYSPHECEDDDLVYRILKNGFKIKSTGKSWVVHYGAMVRGILPRCLPEHIAYFESKNKISFKDFLDMFEYHPVYNEN